ncbi:glutamate--cysteine ligase [Ktedonosporobacter rubrisoli]|uniref:glutamate--cysteine ligase n=1 Tax=Ktedonosporobacter rubrisoli TaxID=2509675 RepID=UPI0013EE9F87|nr:glutamate-cysteine ligase family protein [Ktedonosporobacter rubrisoli]
MRKVPTLQDAQQVFERGFRSSFEQEPRWIGLENEYLLVTQDGKIAERETVSFLWHALIQQGWEAVYDEISKKVVGVKRKRSISHPSSTYQYDLITVDLGYAILEIDLAPAPSLIVARSHLRQILAAITSLLRQKQVVLLGYGIQPLTPPEPTLFSEKGSSDLMYELYCSENAPRPDEHGVDMHTITAARQTHVECSAEEAIPLLNALNVTSGLRVALLANSSLWRNQLGPYKATRLTFNTWLWPGRRAQMGMPPVFRNSEHYIDYIFHFRSISLKREHMLYRLDTRTLFSTFYGAEQGQLCTGEDGSQKVLLSEAEDVNTQCKFAWFTTRLQPGYGTIEDRVSCQQPPHEHWSASALTIGLVENEGPLIQLASTLSYDRWYAIYELACEHGMQFHYPGVDLDDYLKQILIIATNGLQRRGFGEEAYLEPLVQRVAKHCCPADEVAKLITTGGIKAVVAYGNMESV